MEFISKLVETDESKQMKKLLPEIFGSYEDVGFRLFNGIPINENIHLSIQASYGHYCTPRKTLPLEQYTAMELAIFKNGEFVNVEEVVRDNTELVNKLNEYYVGTVYTYVPVELIEKLYQELIK